MHSIICRKSKATKQGLAPIALQYIYLRVPKIITLKAKCKPSDWDENLQKVKKSAADYRDCNGEIEEILAKAERAAAILTINNIEPTFENFKAALELSVTFNTETKEEIMQEFETAAAMLTSVQRKMSNLIEDSGLPIEFNFDYDSEEPEPAPELKKQAKKNTAKKSDVATKEAQFQTAYDAYIDFSKDTKSYETWSRYNGNLDTIKAYLVVVGKPCTFETFAEPNFGSKLQKYLLTEHYNYVKKRKGICGSTVFTICKFLGTLLKWCVKNRYCEYFETSEVRVKSRPETDCLYLSEDEMKPVLKLMYAQTLSPSLQESIELWVLSASTGLRYGDLKRLKNSYIKKANDGYYIDFRTKKKKKQACTPITSVTRWILDKYKGIYPNDTTQLCIPMKANAQLNIDIKEILSLPEIGYNEPEYLRTKTYDMGSEEMIEEHKTLAQFIGMHSGRRTFINKAVNRGIVAEKLAAMLGCDVKNISNYYKTDPNELVKAALLLEDEPTELKIAA